MEPDRKVFWSLPDEPLLRQAAVAIRDSERWGCVFDSKWRLIYATEALIQAWGGEDSASRLHGMHYLNQRRLPMNAPELGPPLARRTGPVR